MSYHTMPYSYLSRHSQDKIHPSERRLYGVGTVFVDRMRTEHYDPVMAASPTIQEKQLKMISPHFRPKISFSYNKEPKRSRVNSLVGSIKANPRSQLFVADKVNQFDFRGVQKQEKQPNTKKANIKLNSNVLQFSYNPPSRQLKLYVKGGSTKTKCSQTSINELVDSKSLSKTNVNSIKATTSHCMDNGVGSFKNQKINGSEKKLKLSSEDKLTFNELSKKSKNTVKYDFGHLMNRASKSNESAQPAPIVKEQESNQIKWTSYVKSLLDGDEDNLKLSIHCGPDEVQQSGSFTNLNILAGFGREVQASCLPNSH